VCVNDFCHIKGLITELRKVCGLLLLEMVGHPVLILGIRLRASRQDSPTLCKRCRARALVPFLPEISRRHTTVGCIKLVKPKHKTHIAVLGHLGEDTAAYQTRGMFAV